MKIGCPDTAEWSVDVDPQGIPSGSRLIYYEHFSQVYIPPPPLANSLSGQELAFSLYVGAGIVFFLPFYFTCKL